MADLPSTPRRIVAGPTFVTDPEEDQNAATAFDCPRACCRKDAPDDSPPRYWGWRREK